MANKACILTIDGGGIRSVIPAMILRHIEKGLQKRNSNYQLSDFFDLFVGTDMGGLLASVLVVPGDGGRAKYSTNDALEIFTKKGQAIFDVSVWKNLRSMGGMTDEKYTSKGLEKLLKKYLIDYRLGDVVKPLMLSAYDLRNREAKIYSYTDVDDPMRNFYLRDLCRASSAIPSYFEPARIESEAGTPFSLISGNLFASNPTMIAYAESRKINFSRVLDQEDKPIFPQAKDLFILSLGTGKISKPYYFDTVKDWGEMSWLKPTIDMLTSSNAETVDYQMKQLFSTITSANDYIRLNPKLGGVSDEIDDASAKNISNLVALSEAFIEKHKDKLDLIIERLIDYNRVD